MPLETIPFSLSKVQNHERFCEVLQTVAERVKGKKEFLDFEPIEQNPYHPVQKKFHHDLYAQIITQGAGSQYNRLAMTRDAIDDYRKEAKYFSDITIDRLYYQNLRYINDENHIDYILTYRQRHPTETYDQAFSCFLEAKNIIVTHKKLQEIGPKVFQLSAPDRHIEKQVHDIDQFLGHPEILLNSEKNSANQNSLSEFSLGPGKDAVDVLLNDLKILSRPEL